MDELLEGVLEMIAQLIKGVFKTMTSKVGNDKHMSGKYKVVGTVTLFLMILGSLALFGTETTTEAIQLLGVASDVMD